MEHEKSFPQVTPFKTPLGFKILAIVCIAAPLAMMAHNADVKIQDLTSETVALESENGLLTRSLKQGREKIAALNAEIRVGEVQRDDLLKRLDNLERREESLQNVVVLLKEELIVAEEEAKLVAATYQKSTNQLRKIVHTSEETAYALLQENRELKQLVKSQETSMISMLGEVSTLNAELAYIKDERDEMGREILRITAQVKSLEAETGVMAVKAEARSEDQTGG